jgi:hypothetical protein
VILTVSDATAASDTVKITVRVNRPLVCEKIAQSVPHNRLLTLSVEKIAQTFCNFQKNAQRKQSPNLVTLTMATVELPVDECY